MINETAALRKIYASVFESALLNEIEEKSILITANGGQTLINMGQNIKVVPMVISGTLKISRVNEDGDESLVSYLKEKSRITGSGLAYYCRQAENVL
jgi:CRP/FNR family transcriptional regulator